MELVFMVSSVGVDDDEAFGLKLLVVGGRLELVEAFLYLDLSPLLVVGVVEA